MTINEAAQILGISVNATVKELQSAFRKLVLKWHPDKHPNDKHAEEMMKKINEAHKVFKEYLDKGGNTNTGAQSGTRPGGNTGSRPNGNASSGGARPSGSTNTTNNTGFSDRRQFMLKDLWNKYQDAKSKYDAFKVELRKAFDKKVAEQKKYDELKDIFAKSPTAENLRKLSEEMTVWSRATLDHGTAKMAFQRLKLEMDMWKRQHDVLLTDIENDNRKTRR